MIYTKNESCIYSYSKQLVVLKTKLYSIESEYREALELIDLFLVDQDSKNFKRLLFIQTSDSYGSRYNPPNDYHQCT